MFNLTRRVFSNPLTAPFSLILAPFTLTIDLIALPFQMIYSFYNLVNMDTKDLVIVHASEEKGIRRLLVTNRSTSTVALPSLSGTQMVAQDLRIDHGTNFWGTKTIAVSDKNRQQLDYRFIGHSPNGDIYQEYRSSEQVQALSELSDKGLRSEHLRNWRKPLMGDFGKGHLNALKLLASHRIFGQEAINEINNLTDQQAHALVLLHDSGLRNEHLRAWQAPEFDSFGKGHIDALLFLARQRIFGIEAIRAINGLTELQADALVRLYDSGLRREHLRSWRAPEFASFGKGHIDALELLARHRITGTEAINAINGLNELQANALVKLYNSGLRGEHLRSWQSPEFGSFERGHIDALSSLANRNINGQQAIRAINNLNGSEARAKVNANVDYAGAFFVERRGRAFESGVELDRRNEI